MNKSYRIQVDGDERWMKLKEIMTGFDHELLLKGKTDRGSFHYFMKIDEDMIEDVKDAISELDVSIYVNTLSGCLEQAMSELMKFIYSDKLTIDDKLRYLRIRMYDLAHILDEKGLLEPDESLESDEPIIL